jgi:hypothetical protein
MGGEPSDSCTILSSSRSRCGGFPKHAATNEHCSQLQSVDIPFLPREMLCVPNQHRDRSEAINELLRYVAVVQCTSYSLRLRDRVENALICSYCTSCSSKSILPEIPHSELSCMMPVAPRNNHDHITLEQCLATAIVKPLCSPLVSKNAVLKDYR